MTSWYQGRVLYAFHPRVDWVVAFVIETAQPVEELEPYGNKHLGEIPNGSRQGLEPKGQHFLPTS